MTDETVRNRTMRARANQGQQAPAPRFRLVCAPKGLTVDSSTGDVAGGFKFKNARKNAGLRVERVPGIGARIAQISLIRA